MNDFQKMAVLIDADNTQLSKLEDMLNEVSTYGRIVVKKAYGNWKKPSLARWEDKIKRLAIKPEQQFDYVSGKNTSDIAIVIDAIDMLHTGMYDAMVLVSSDSDFTPLAVRLRESGIYVIGVGEKKTLESFRNACDNFIFLEYITNGNKNENQEKIKKLKENKKEDEEISKEDVAEESPESYEANPNIDEVHLLLKIAYDRYQDDDDFVNVSIAGTYIKRVMPEFDPKAYGFSKLSDIIKAFPSKYEIKKEKKNGNAAVISYRCKQR